MARCETGLDTRMAPAANDRPIHHRRTIRLPGWDYAADGAYFVTVCSNYRTDLFGEIVGGRMRLNAAGDVAARVWPLAAPIRRKTVGRLIGAFKTVSTKHINQLHNTPGTVIWQRNFWEHIVRDVAELDRIRDYIRENPTNWPADPLNPDRVLPVTNP
jgi:putative transposase